MAKCDSQCWQQWPKLQVPCSPQLCRIQKVHDRPSPTICSNLRLYSTGISPLAALAFHSHLLSMTHMSCILVVTVDVTSHKHSHQDGWHQDVDRIWFGHVQTKHFFLPSTAADDVIPRGSGSAGFSCPLSDYLSRPTAHTGSNLKLSNMGTSLFVFGWHLLSMMHMSCILLMISRCHRPSKFVKVVWSPSLGFVFTHHPLLQHACLFFLLFCICRRWIGQHTHWHPNGWQDMTKFGHVQTKHCFLPSKPLNCGRWCHAKWQWFCGIQLSTIRLSAKTARTGNNLRLSNIGTSPSAFRWHFLSMMHMSCILLMISCCSLTLQKCQSRLVSSLGFVFTHQPLLQHACLLFLLFASADSALDKAHTHTHSHEKWLTRYDKVWPRAN